MPRPPILGLEHDRPRLMGILNVTPDSFSDGGRHGSSVALDVALDAMSRADIIDVGGESTRPGAQDVNASAEIARVVPAIRRCGNPPRQRRYPQGRRRPCRHRSGCECRQRCQRSDLRPGHGVRLRRCRRARLRHARSVRPGRHAGGTDLCRCCSGRLRLSWMRKSPAPWRRACHGTVSSRIRASGLASRWTTTCPCYAHFRYFTPWECP